MKMAEKVAGYAGWPVTREVTLLHYDRHLSDYKLHCRYWPARNTRHTRDRAYFRSKQSAVADRHARGWSWEKGGAFTKKGYWLARLQSQKLGTEVCI